MLVFSHASVAAQSDFVSSADGGLGKSISAELVPERDMATAFVSQDQALD